MPYEQPQYYQPYGAAPAYSELEQEDRDKVNITIAIVSFLVPLAGWIIGAQQKHEKPNAAGIYSQCAWIGFVLNLTIRLIMAIA